MNCERTRSWSTLLCISSKLKFRFNYLFNWDLGCWGYRKNHLHCKQLIFIVSIVLFDKSVITVNFCIVIIIVHYTSYTNLLINLHLHYIRNKFDRHYWSCKVISYILIDKCGKSVIYQPTGLTSIKFLSSYLFGFVAYTFHFFILKTYFDFEKNYNKRFWAFQSY
jgi:hypothetical protein